MFDDAPRRARLAAMRARVTTSPSARSSRRATSATSACPRARRRWAASSSPTSGAARAPAASRRCSRSRRACTSASSRARRARSSPTTAASCVTMQRLSRDSGIPRRTLYNLYAARELDAACRRRAQTVWRARFEHARAGRDGRSEAAAVRGDRRARRVGRIGPVPRRSGAVRAPVRSPSGRRTTTCASTLPRSTASRRSWQPPRGSHRPSAFAAFVATSVAGAAAWYDRRAAARAASIVFVEREIARRR